MVDKKTSALSVTSGLLVTLISMAVCGISIYLLVVSSDARVAIGESLYFAVVGLTAVVGVSLVTSVFGALASLSGHILGVVLSVVIIVGVVVCEISTGIFLELEKNDALALASFPVEFMDLPQSMQASVSAEYNCVITQHPGNSSSRYGCQGSSSDPNDMSCGFRVTDYLCLFLMILEVVLLALIIFQVVSIVLTVIHMWQLRHESDNRVYPQTDDT